MEILVKYFDDETYFTNGKNGIQFTDNGDWLDLRASKSVMLFGGEYQLIPLGVAIQLPEGYEANIVPRSSTYKNFGIIQTNSFGVVDESYKGDNDQWMFPAFALRDTLISKGDRICQFRIQRKQEKFDIVRVETLNNEDRDGFGSSGVK